MLINLLSLCKSLTISQLKNDGLPNIRRVAYDERKLIKDSKKFMIDIDGTICKTEKSNYHGSIPIKKNIKLFNELYDKGHSPNDILLTFMKFLLEDKFNIEEELKLKIYEIVSLSFIRVNDGIQTLLQLCGCLSKIHILLNK